MISSPGAKRVSPFTPVIPPMINTRSGSSRMTSTTASSRILISLPTSANVILSEARYPRWLELRLKPSGDPSVAQNALSGGYTHQLQENDTPPQSIDLL